MLVHINIYIYIPVHLTCYNYSIKKVL